jgi:hypothetical protein
LWQLVFLHDTIKVWKAQVIQKSTFLAEHLSTLRIPYQFEEGSPI